MRIAGMCVIVMAAAIGCSQKPVDTPTKEESKPVNFGGKSEDKNNGKKDAEKKPDAYERALVRFGKPIHSTDESLTWDEPKEGGSSVTIDFSGEPGKRKFSSALIHVPEFVRQGKGGQWIMRPMPATETEAVALLEKWKKGAK